MLPPEDEAFLSAKVPGYQIHQEDNTVCVVFLAVKLPAGYSHAAVDVLVKLSALYPDIAPDMWWVDPPLTLQSGVALPATDVMEAIVGRQWQRWSRHFSGDQWRAGTDNLRSYLALIRSTFEAAAGGS